MMRATERQGHATLYADCTPLLTGQNTLLSVG
jgi:hypothetical protein